MSEIDGVGEAVEGAMAARAAEPDTGVAPSGHTGEEACLNCGAILDGPYCRECGQRAHVHRSLGAFLHDLMHGVLHFEGKIWRTLPLAFFKPGELTRRYIEGERARFVSPIALFLFFVFLAFATFSVAGVKIAQFDGLDEQARVSTQLETERGALQALEAERSALAGEDGPEAQDAALERMQFQDGATLTEVNRESLRLKALGGVENAIEEQRADVELLQALETRGVETIAFPKARNDNFDEATAEANRAAEEEDWWFNRAWRDAKKDPALLAYKIQTTAYKFAWLLIPISVPMVWLLFPGRRRFALYDHTVFVTYSVSVMIFLLMLSAVGAALESTFLAAAPVIAMPVHIALHLKGAYRLRWGQWAWRLPLLYLVCLLAGFVFMFTLILIGIA